MQKGETFVSELAFPDGDMSSTVLIVEYLYVSSVAVVGKCLELS